MDTDILLFFSLLFLYIHICYVSRFGGNKFRLLTKVEQYFSGALHIKNEWNKNNKTQSWLEK